MRPMAQPVQASRCQASTVMEPMAPIIYAPQPVQAQASTVMETSSCSGLPFIAYPRFDADVARPQERQPRGSRSRSRTRRSRRGPGSHMLADIEAAAATFRRSPNSMPLGSTWELVGVINSGEGLMLQFERVGEGDQDNVFAMLLHQVRASSEVTER